MILLITVVFLTIFISSQCSLYEATLYSTRMGTLEAERADPARGAKARRMIDLKQRISAPLSAILILNTLANTAGATLAGMYAHQALGAVYVPLFSVVFTLSILFFAEIIPKTLGAVYWRHFWPLVIWPLTFMKWGLYPFIRITEVITSLLTRKQAAPNVTAEDILGTIRLGAKGGEISHWESLMLHNIMRLDTVRVRDIMTPRTVLFTLPEEETVSRVFEKTREMGHTRIPLYRGDRENIVGYVMQNDLSLAMIRGEDTPLRDLAKPIRIVPETENCLVLLTEFLKSRRHIAVAWDDYGGLAGLVTLEDLIETVLGTEIVDESDLVVDLQQMARKRRQARFPGGRADGGSGNGSGEGNDSETS